MEVIKTCRKEEIEFWRRRVNKVRYEMADVVAALDGDATLSEITSSITKVAVSVQTIATILDEILTEKYGSS